MEQQKIGCKVICPHCLKEFKHNLPPDYPVSEKYMIEIKRYPRGGNYPTVFALGRTAVKSKPKVVKKEPTKQKKIVETESY